LDQFDCENGRIAVDFKPQNENSIARSIRCCVANMPGVWSANNVQGYRQGS
jgi:hypothetical protein